MTNPYIPALSAELERASIHDWTVERGGKHPRIVYMHEGRQRFYVFPGSPSDGQHGIRNAVADLRRHLGLSAPVVVRSTRPKKRRAEAVVQVPDSFAVRPDPLLALLAWKPPAPPSRFRWIWVGPGRHRVEVRDGPEQAAIGRCHG